MFPQLARFTDFALLLLRLMVGLVFVTSGYAHLKNPEERSKSIGMSKTFTIFLGIAEVFGALGLAFGVLTQLAAFYPKIAVAYTQIATISTDDHHTLQEFRASVGAQWTFLSDPGRTIQKDLDIQEYTDPEHNPMIPHTLVLKPGLVIYSVYNGYWFWGRPSVVDLWHDLRAVTSEIRPDWDLSTPGLREAWNAGDLSRFHGWNKRASKEGSPNVRK